jgi:1,4-dihydroxy-2-naphthoyl-CoA hydrolase
VQKYADPPRVLAQGYGMTSTSATPYAGLGGLSARDLQDFSRGSLPDWLGIELTSVQPDRLTCRVPVRPDLLGPHGYLHGGALVSVADSLCGYGAVVNLPAGAGGFLTVELKTNFLGSLRRGALLAEATPVHLGRTTQVWDATITDEHTGRLLAMFRCTQMVLWDPHDAGARFDPLGLAG